MGARANQAVEATGYRRLTADVAGNALPARRAWAAATPGRDRSPSGLRECIAAKYFVAERLRVPTGGAAGRGPRSRRRGKPRRYKKANASPPSIL